MKNLSVDVLNSLFENWSITFVKDEEGGGYIAKCGSCQIRRAKLLQCTIAVLSDWFTLKI